MKHSLVVFSLFISSISFAGTIGNGVKLLNLPTATKSYSETVYSEGQVDFIKTKVNSACQKDKAEVEEVIAKLGSKILSSTGCSASVTGGYYDQGGSEHKVEAKFEVIFK